MPLVVAVASLAVSAYSAYSNIKSQGEAREQSALAAGEQRKAQSESVALNTQRAAMEKRQQLREARVRQGKLLQAAENTGAGDSSGEAGAQAGLATQLGANIGFNVGQIAGQNRANQFGQAAADYQTGAQAALSEASTAQSIFNLSTSIFTANGGTSAFKSK